MQNLTSENLVANGITLHYYRIGAGTGNRLPLVLIHGITDDGLCWLPVAEALADRCDVIMVDARGHGKSDDPDGDCSIVAMATDVAELIKGLELARPVVLGHSMGAVIAMALAGNFPELSRAIILEDPPPFWMFDPVLWEKTRNRNHMAEWMAGLKRKTYADLLAEVRTSNPHWQEAEIEPWVNSKHRFSLKLSNWGNPQDLIATDFPTLLPRITCPTLFIAADPERGPASGEADIAQLKARVPQLRVANVANAGHSIRRDQFGRYMDILRQALDEYAAL